MCLENIKTLDNWEDNFVILMRNFALNVLFNQFFANPD